MNPWSLHSLCVQPHGQWVLWVVFVHFVLLAVHNTPILFTPLSFPSPTHAERHSCQTDSTWLLPARVVTWNLQSRSARTELWSSAAESQHADQIAVKALCCNVHVNREFDKGGSSSGMNMWSSRQPDHRASDSSSAAFGGSPDWKPLRCKLLFMLLCRKRVFVIWNMCTFILWNCSQSISWQNVYSAMQNIDGGA